ncbi:MAG: metallophosphoesterase [Lachnospira sp.]|nr:metallophosphoesterase [Lachnospira sp.]
MSIYITGDTHGNFERVADFCESMGTTEEDVLIILGDAGINYFADSRDESTKRDISEIPITLFCIHGNHEERPYEIDTYEEMEWNGGVVYYEPEFPNILFAKDGEIYDFDGRRCIAIGGAYSVDKYYRLSHGMRWYETEQPTEEIMEYVERQLDKNGWRVDCVFSHTVPEPYEPRWAFIPGLDQSTVDKSTEKWLDRIEKRLDYDRWYAGHYHVESQEGPIRIMFEEFDEL